MRRRANAGDQARRKSTGKTGKVAQTSRARFKTRRIMRASETGGGEEIEGDDICLRQHIPSFIGYRIPLDDQAMCHVT
ncbi:integrase [Pandoraea sputorum]|uniref:Integrase n=1 Tax=Pandoraea sputorum TaxID=93222 RepID=A0A5E5BIJ3_9BURK|nr:integrase [Pandoraea sputorum]